MIGVEQQIVDNIETLSCLYESSPIFVTDYFNLEPATESLIMRQILCPNGPLTDFDGSYSITDRMQNNAPVYISSDSTFFMDVDSKWTIVNTLGSLTSINVAENSDIVDDVSEYRLQDYSTYNFSLRFDFQ